MPLNPIPYKDLLRPTVSSPILFTPGMSCDERLWTKTFDFMPNISSRHFVNFSGCTVLPEFMERISESSVQKFGLVGFSMGGYIAIEYALQNPDRISSLVLISCSARGYSASEKQQRQKMIESASTQFDNLASKSRLMNLISPKHSDTQKEKILDTMEAMMRDGGVKTLIEQQTATLDRLDRRTALSKLELPVLIIQGCDDSLLPLAQAEDLSRIVPKAKLEIIQGGGHMLPLECPENVANLLQKWFDISSDSN